MFTIVPHPTFVADAQITIPGAEQPSVLRVVWRHKGRADLKTWIESLGHLSDIDGLMQVIADWEGVVDDNKLPVHFTRDALSALLDAFPAAAGELYRRYPEALFGSRLGN